jgi:excinuclease ABC subunit C
MPDFKNQIKLLPNKPGIYKFSDKHQEIIYIGKAKNLKKRVSSYFVKHSGHSGRIKVMVSRIARINYTVVESEQEALLLENSLIKKYQPKYNVRLKDGKTYPFIAIKNEHFPRVFSTRSTLKDGSEYFGPFVSGLNKNMLLDLLQKHFYIRTCKYNLSPENIHAGKFKVCLSYHINLCKGPCEAHQNEKEYQDNIENVRQILKGKTASVIEYVGTKMQQAAEDLEFEKANELKHTLDALKGYEAKSTVVNPKLTHIDVLALYSAEGLAIVNYLRIVNGAIVQTDTIEYKKSLNESDPDILTLAITEFRNRYNSESKEVVVPYKPEFQDSNLKYSIPKTGDKKKLLELSYKNAWFYYKDLQEKKNLQQDKSQRNINLLKQVQKDLILKKLPFVIECFDNSNMQGSYPVAALTVFKNGKPLKSAYRHYNIKTVEGPDDFASMEEVIYRRYRRLLEEDAKLPDLIVIDGGKGQITSAYKSLVALGIEDKVDMVGIAKKLEEIFKVGDTLPLGIDKKSPTNRLIQHIRNEAHRFGITHHRSRRIRGSLVTELNSIEGIGKLTAQKLLSSFKSVNGVKEADFDELSSLVGKHKALLIQAYFKKNP